ncbi:MAG: hypothetical protein IIZ25_10840 [Thermoguttaceae bacterium]|nr:hypothetical protein [Thermoguttaceae bacterium]
MAVKKSILLFAVLFVGLSTNAPLTQALPAATVTTSLDGTWQVRIDPDNAGKDEEWFARPLSESGETSPLAVPGVIQQVWPDYHGLAWYERTFPTPDNPNENGRVVLRFWQAEYRADVWLNGTYLGFHEGGEAAFELDTAGALNPARGEPNRLTVRVLNAADTPIDGISMANIPRRNNTNVISPGSGYASGGLVDSVELLAVPAVRMTDLQLLPDWKTGVIEARAAVENTLPGKISAALSLTAASTDGGALFPGDPSAQIVIPEGKSVVTSKVTVPDFKLWELNDPNLYTVIAKLSALEFISPSGNRRDAAKPTLRDVGTDLRTAVCGFRDFRFERGAFRLNGKRIYLKCSHSGSDSPITHRLPLDPDLYRRDILTCKAMGFNMIRYIAGMPRRFQLDLCDRVGFMVYDECLAGWCYEKCPERIGRYTDQVLGMIERDRNHPCVAIWGLLNETSDAELVLYASSLLPLVRKADPDRVVILNSGSFDQFALETPKTADFSIWRRTLGTIMPGAIKNCTDKDFDFDGTHWLAGTFCLHPGDAGGEYAAARFTAPAEGKYKIESRFFDVVKDGHATVSIDLFRGDDEKIWSGDLNLASQSASAEYRGELDLAAGQTFTVVVGIGDGAGYGDTTAVDLKITAPDGTLYDVTADCGFESNPAGVWSYGYLPAGERPDLSAFTLFALGQKQLCFEPLGRYANPNEVTWNNDLADIHPYKMVPHTAGVIQELRTAQSGSRPIFLSEYGVGSAVDLFRLTRLFEQNHATGAADAKHYRQRLDGFMADWNRWKLDDAFYGPEDFFRQAIARMAEQRRIGINAIRANPRVVAHSVTGTHDQGISGEGLTTLWREYKPGTLEVMADLFAPLRFCNFVEPVQCFSGSQVRFESVLVNEDILPPGDYPARFIVTGPDNKRVFDEVRTVTVPVPPEGEENPMVLPIFDETFPVAGPQGEYHFRVEFEKDAAACGGDERFFVTDPATLPPVDFPVAVWGDPALADLLRGMGVDVSLLDTAAANPEGLRIIVGKVDQPSAQGYAELMKLVDGGAHVLFVSPKDAMAVGNDLSALWPLPVKGTFEYLPNWLYHKDDWTKNSPFFEGLPRGDVSDYLFYRELIPQLTFNGPDLVPDEAIAGAFNTQMGYSAGLSLASWNVGRGRVVISTWRILENLPGHPAAERLLRNMLRAL